MGDGIAAWTNRDVVNWVSEHFGLADGAIVHVSRLPVGGTRPNWKYLGHKPALALREITDGTSHTFLIGEKHVPVGKFGYMWDPSTRAVIGDNSIYNGSDAETVVRYAGTGFPLALSPEDPVNSNFGSYHPGVCQFVLADASIRALSVSIDTALLDLLANRHDGQTIRSDAFD
jgi:hypothetical protein